MFQIQILKYYSWVLAGYAIIQDMFNLDTCPTAWCLSLIIAQIVDIKVHK